jgi:hypothetical protein
MALLSSPIVVEGANWGTSYTLEKAGDEFPVHTHTDDNNHITVLAFGTVRCIGRQEIEGLVLECKPGGTVIDWQAGKPHGFVALTDGATLINILKK